MSRTTFAVICIALLLAACAPAAPPQTFRVTEIGVQPTAPFIPSATQPPTRTPTPTPTLPPTATFTPTATLSPTPTVSSTPTPSATPTQALFTLTPATGVSAPAAVRVEAAPIAVTDGWSCGDFPCADDINDFLRRIQVPRGFAVSHYGRFPGQPMQIAFGRDGRLYATVLENGTRSGAVYALNSDGSSERYAGDFLSPVGLAFQPGTDVLYVSARSSEATGGALYRVQANGDTRLVLDDLPCCFSLDNQPNGMVFGPDGYLYLGVGSLTDRAEPPDPRRARFAEIDPLEASVLRIQPHTGAVEAYARGIRNPYDVAFDSSGTFYASDQGLLTGAGDRLLRLETGGHYGFPYWVGRGFCAECPFTPPNLTVLPDLLPLPDFTLPRGMVVYDGVQFPSNMFDSLFVAFWNGGDNGQRIVRIEPNNVPTDAEALALYTPEAFATGFIRPVDVIVAPDGALLVADFVYGHVWRIGYEGIP